VVWVGQRVAAVKVVGAVWMDWGGGCRCWCWYWCCCCCWFHLFLVSRAALAGLLCQAPWVPETYQLAPVLSAQLYLQTGLYVAVAVAVAVPVAVSVGAVAVAVAVAAVVEAVVVVLVCVGVGTQLSVFAPLIPG